MTCCATILYSNNYMLYVCVQAHGHSEDILSIAVGLTNLMATSSFDGEVIVLLFSYM